MGVPGLGLDAGGKPIQPPDPGRQRVQQAVQDRDVSKGKPKPRSWYPLAERTRDVGAFLDNEFPGSMHVSVSDMATSLKLPEKAGQLVARLFHWRLFRVERLTREAVQKYEPLRNDAEYFRQRTAALVKEMLTTHREMLTQCDVTLAGAAILLQEPFLLDRVRKRCREWIDRPGTERFGLPMQPMRALGLAGDSADFALLHAWVKRRPEDAPTLTDTVTTLLQRKVARDALPLVADLLRDPAPGIPEGNARRLLDADKSLPALTRGDQFLIAVLQRFKRNPADFGLASAPERLLAQRLTTSAQDRDRVETAVMYPHAADWLFVTPADRTRAIDQALAWLKQR